MVALLLSLSSGALGLVGTVLRATGILAERDQDGPAWGWLVAALVVGLASGVLWAYLVTALLRDAGVLDRRGLVYMLVDRVADFLEGIIMPLLDFIPGVDL